MNDKILGFDKNVVLGFLLLLLLIIIGILSFHYYVYVSGSNGLSFGSGFGVNLLGKKEQNNK